MFELLAAFFVFALVGSVFFIAFTILKFAFKLVVGIAVFAVAVACFGVVLAAIIPLLVLAAIVGVPVALVSAFA